MRFFSAFLPYSFFQFSQFLGFAAAFGTINEPSHIGQHSEHERLTHAAFACPLGVTVSDGACFEELSLMQLAGTSGPEGYIGQGFNGAVGAPDTLDPTPEGPEAHCDNADFLDSASFGLDEEYPQTREKATAQLQKCVDHLRERFGEGIDAADHIIDEYARIIELEVDLSAAHCTFSFPELQMHMFSRSKCSAIEGFGRALHGVQDFYAHSNWADVALPPYSPQNPPGLGRRDYPLFMDLRAENEIGDQVPLNLSTGCFGGVMTDGPVGQPGHPLEPGSMDCTGRITHFTLNKDNGQIDPMYGNTSSPGPNTPRSDVNNNFERAVSAAIRDSKRQWRYFREEIRRMYGTERGNIIICSLVRDNPTKDCYGRRIAIVRDADHGIRGGNRVADMQIPIQSWLLTELAGHPHDEGPGEGPTETNTTKSRGSSDDMRMPIPVRDDGIASLPLVSEGLDISTSVTELVKNATGIPTNKTAIVALTSTHNQRLGDEIGHIWRAGDHGIRMHLGLLPPERSRLFGPPVQKEVKVALSQAMEEDLITAILRTGGTYSILHHASAIPSFLDHVISKGLTQYDNPRDTATLLLEGLSIGDYVTPEAEPRRYSFDAHALDNVILAVAPITSKLKLHVALRHVRKNIVLREVDVGIGGNATFRAELGVEDVPRGDAWFELEVAHVPGDGLVGSGLFEVSLETEAVGHHHHSLEDEWEEHEVQHARNNGEEELEHEEL